MKFKPFDTQEHKACDGPAKEIAKEWMLQTGCSNIEINEQEETQWNLPAHLLKIWDIKAQHPTLGEIRIDTEIKKDWATKWPELFHLPSVDIPYRKGDHHPGAEYPTHHMVIGGDHARFFLTDRQTVLSAPAGRKDVKNMSKPDAYFRIPLLHLDWLDDRMTKFNTIHRTPENSSWWIKEKDGIWRIYDYEKFRNQ